MAVIEQAAPWLLDQPVQSVKHEENIELPVSNIRSDQVFRVTLADGKEIIMHLEFEASSTVQEMRWRMLQYMTRLAEKFKMPISVVLYLGNKGKDDTGNHREEKITWQYKVIRLQDIQARELLDMDRVSLLPLIGLTTPKEAEKEHFEAIDIIKRRATGRHKKQLLTFLLELVPDRRLMDMVETYLEKDDLLLNTPYLQKIRDQGREEERGKERKMIAKEMKKEGLDVNMIIKFTKLTVEEIEKL